jgi:hypothetical protein
MGIIEIIQALVYLSAMIYLKESISAIEHEEVYMRLTVSAFLFLSLP